MYYLLLLVGLLAFFVHALECEWALLKECFSTQSNFQNAKSKADKTMIWFLTCCCESVHLKWWGKWTTNSMGPIKNWKINLNFLQKQNTKKMATLFMVYNTAKFSLEIITVQMRPDSTRLSCHSTLEWKISRCGIPVVFPVRNPIHLT